MFQVGATKDLFDGEQSLLAFLTAVVEQCEPARRSIYGGRTTPSVFENANDGYTPAWKFDVDHLQRKQPRIILSESLSAHQ